MSGSKVISVSGIAQTSATASTAGISGAMVAMGAATVVGLTALVTAAEMAVTLTGKARLMLIRSEYVNKRKRRNNCLLYTSPSPRDFG